MGNLESLAPASGLPAAPEHPQARSLCTYTFNHLDPDGTRNPYTDEQSIMMSKAMLAAPRGGTLRLPGFEDRFEVRWGAEAKAWKRAATGMYQDNIQNGNKRLIEVNEIDAWIEAQEQALNGDIAKIDKKPCRYWDKCYNCRPEHRQCFLHPVQDRAVAGGGLANHKVQLVASVIGSIGVATAYHTSVLVDGEEFSFSDYGIFRARGPESHSEAPKPCVIKDYGTSPESGDRLFAVLKDHFRRGTYDLLNKNCNSFSDLALYYLVQERLKSKYKVLERVGSYMPSLITKFSGGDYVPNVRAADFDPETVVPELDKILEIRGDAAPAGGGYASLTLCSVGCGRPAANGFPTCCRTCQNTGGAKHGPTCQASAPAAPPVAR